jgi:hypothetical protein
VNALRDRLPVVALFTGLSLVGCGAVPNATESSTTIIAKTEHVFELACRESAQFLAVDSGRARGYVPRGYTVFVIDRDAADVSRALPDGSAILIIIYQECSAASWDGMQLAPLKMVHHWIRLDGPHEILPVPGTSRTVPTYYWYMLDDPTTSIVLRQRLREVGITSSKIESIELGFDINGVRTGGVVEKNTPGSKDDISYSFVENNRPSERLPVGVNHRLFHETCDDNGRCTLMKALDSGFIIPFGSGSPVTVTAHPDSSVARLWGTTELSGIATQFEHMEFKVKISSGIPLLARSDH